MGYSRYVPTYIRPTEYVCIYFPRSTFELHRWGKVVRFLSVECTLPRFASPITCSTLEMDGGTDGAVEHGVAISIFEVFTSFRGRVRIETYTVGSNRCPCSVSP